MPDQSISSLDALRAQNPDLGFALYAMEPRGVVTLEVLTPDGEIFAFKGETAAAAMASAFPEPAPPEPSPEPVAADIFA